VTSVGADLLPQMPLKMIQPVAAQILVEVVEAGLKLDHGEVPGFGTLSQPLGRPSPRVIGIKRDRQARKFGRWLKGRQVSGAEKGAEASGD